MGILLDDFGGREDGAGDELGDGGAGGVDEGLGQEGIGGKVRVVIC